MDKKLLNNLLHNYTDFDLWAVFIFKRNARGNIARVKTRIFEV